MPKVPGIVPVKYSTAITTANKVRRIRSVVPMFGFIGAVFMEQRCCDMLSLMVRIVTDHRKIPG